MNGKTQEFKAHVSPNGLRCFPGKRSDRLDEARGTAVPGIFPRSANAGFDERLPVDLVIGDLLQGGRDRGHIEGIEIDGGIGTDLTYGRDVSGSRKAARLHSFERRDPESLIDARKDKGLCASIERLDLGIGQPTGADDIGGQRVQTAGAKDFAAAPTITKR
jgi:hypothetical protein